jgi:hypothetical protein
VLNHSWSLRDASGNPGRYSSTVRNAFAYAYKANRTSVVAMGNHQLTHLDMVAYPAGFGNVISVGATDNNDIIRNSSAHGDHIDVTAPGENILSTYIGGGYDYLSGTSMATPHVSGLASLMKGFKNTLSNDDIEQIIRLSADKLPAMNGADFNNTYGFGRINASWALEMVRCNMLRQWSATGGAVYSSTSNFSSMAFLSASGLSDGIYTAKRHEVRKTITFPEQFAQIISVWGRGIGTDGCNLANPNFGEGFCEVVTSTANSVTLRTYVYELYSISGAYLGYYPKAPANVKFEYSVLGVMHVNLFNQIITTNTTVTSCGDINVQNVKVQNGAKLILDAAGEVNIISDFEVALGSEFEIK